MTSAIDPTVPVFGNPTTASVRQNFLIAKNEITNLQRPQPVSFIGSGIISIPTDQDVIVFVQNTSGGPVFISLPNGLVINQQVLIKDAFGNAGTENITIVPLTSIDGNPNYQLVSNFASVWLIWMGSIWGTI